MRDAVSSKLLIPWIETICDSEDYLPLLRWIDRTKKIFYLSWTHKSSANWDTTKSDVFKKWAEYKEKLGEKDDRDVKAAFRNALRSKKNSLRLLKKEKDHMIWQILSEPIKPPKSETTNNKKKPRQRKGGKNNAKTCKPISDMSFQEPPPSTSCNSVFKEFGSLPPCASLFHVSPPSSPLQQTDEIITDSGTLRDSSSMNDPIYGIPSPNAYSNTRSPGYVSVDEPLYGISSPNVHSSPCSPIQMPNDDTQHSAWNSLLSFPNDVPVSMSPEQEVPALDINDLFTSEAEQFSLTNQAQEFSKPNSVQWYPTRDEDTVYHQNVFEVMFDIERDHSSLPPKSPDFNQEALGKVFFLESFDDNMIWNAPERLLFERLVDDFDSMNELTCHQL